MENQLQIFSNPDFGDVRVIGDFENPRFCLADICRILELPQVAKAVQRLGDEVLSRHPIADGMGRMQEMYFVNEDGLYDVILESRKPAAKKLRKWLTAEVVPSIRKTGMYIDTTAPINPAFLRRMADEIENRDKRIAELEPKADYCDKVLLSPEALNVTVIAKEYGMSGAMFNQLLYSLKIQYPSGKKWVLYQEYIGKGYTVTETVITKNGGSITQMKWTQKGREFLYYKLKANNVVPLRERQALMAELL